MTILDSAELLLQAHNYSGSGNWLDESGNGHHAVPANSPAHQAGVRGASYFTLNGTTQSFTIADDDGLDFDTDSESLTLMVVQAADDYEPGASQQILDKRTPFNAGYFIGLSTTSTVQGWIDDEATADTVHNASIPSNGERAVLTLRVDVAGNELDLFIDGTGSASPDTLTGHDLATASGLVIGHAGYDTAAFYAGDVYAVALWRSALSDAEIAHAETLLTAPTSDCLVLLGVP